MAGSVSSDPPDIDTSGAGTIIVSVSDDELASVELAAADTVATTTSPGAKLFAGTAAVGPRSTAPLFSDSVAPVVAFVNDHATVSDAERSTPHTV